MIGVHTGTARVSSKFEWLMRAPGQSPREGRRKVGTTVRELELEVAKLISGLNQARTKQWHVVEALEHRHHLKEVWRYQPSQQKLFGGPHQQGPNHHGPSQQQ